MIIGLSIDIVEIHRISAALQDTQGMKQKVFTAQEISFCSKRKHEFQHFGGRFAAKEAAAKALGGKPEFWFKNIEVLNKESGEPYLKFSGKAQKTYSNLECNIIISISHSENYGVATAILDSWE